MDNLTEQGRLANEFTSILKGVKEKMCKDPLVVITRSFLDFQAAANSLGIVIINNALTQELVDNLRVLADRVGSEPTELKGLDV